jgi:hypothetical protein
MATEKDIMSNDVIKQAFDNNVNKISCIPETIETIEVYDSRLDEKEIIKHFTIYSDQFTCNWILETKDKY